MKRSLAKILTVINMVVMIIVLILLMPYVRKFAWHCAVAVFVVIQLVLNHFLRCPFCGRYPRKGDLFATYCRGCGHSLKEE